MQSHLSRHAQPRASELEARAETGAGASPRAAGQRLCVWGKGVAECGLVAVPRWRPAQASLKLFCPLVSQEGVVGGMDSLAKIMSSLTRAAWRVLEGIIGKQGLRFLTGGAGRAPKLSVDTINEDVFKARYVSKGR
jgi:hypothetical protein